MKATDIAWLAGLLEGEGCFSLHLNAPERAAKHGPTAISIQLKMTDYDVVARAALLMGTTISKQDRGIHKTAYLTILRGTWAVSWMMTIYPLMGTRRREKIRECLAAWKIDPAVPMRSQRFQRALAAQKRFDV